MWSIAVSILLVGCLPGVALYRLPWARRQLRASLAPEERVFWYVVLSLALTSVVGLGLAAAGWYRFERVLWINGAVIVLIVAWLRGRLRLDPTTKWPGWSALIPTGIAIAAVVAYFGARPSEYVIGGKDPGTYTNEGIQIAQSGSLRITDRLVASVPEEFRDLYTREVDSEFYDGSRFMGFYLVDSQDGIVVGQFPHLFPVWIGVAYGVNGLTGARYVVTFLALVGLLAVYFFGAWLVGRPAAAAGTLLLAVNVAQVWYSRYPNAEILLQVFTFAGLLAYSRASVDGDRFFAVVAGVLVALAAVTHLTGVLLIAILVVAACLSGYAGRPLPMVFLTVSIVGSAAAALYYVTFMTPYLERYARVIWDFPNITRNLLIVGMVLGSLVFVSRTSVAHHVRSWLPWGIVAAAWTLSAYAYFFRVPVPGLAPHDAGALRTFAEFYVTPMGLALALVGLVLLARQRFWPGVAFLLVLLGFSVLFFYKIRIIPEHFWAARRFLAVSLPGICLLIGTAAFPLGTVNLPRKLNRRLPRLAMLVAGSLVVMYIGTAYLNASTAIMRHIEYEDIVPRIEAIKDRISDTDLVLVESRQSSDVHTLALPLAYIYARQVLVFHDPDPPAVELREFLTWARSRFTRILFVGGGGTLLLSDSIDAIPLSRETFSVPEYESAYHAYPSEVRLKRYDVAIYELVPRLIEPDGFSLDVGSGDELQLRRFHDQETLGGTDTTFRWSRDRSFVSMLGVSPDRSVLTLWLSNGGRPATSEPATVEVVLLPQVGAACCTLGTVTVADRFEPYVFDIPPILAARVAMTRTRALLELRVSTWNPGEALGINDPRELGVMVDRIMVE